jgi:hypothetical protein
MRRSPTNRAGIVIAFSTAVFVGVLASCDSGPYHPPPLHQFTTSYDFSIQPDEAPPHARDDVHYTIQIFDRKTRQPIESGEGQLFAGKPIDPDAPTGPQSKTYDGLSYGPQVGTYHAKLNFVISGTWAVAIRFRRDSLHPLERTDWMQDVLNEKPSNTP